MADLRYTVKLEELKNTSKLFGKIKGNLLKNIFSRFLLFLEFNYKTKFFLEIPDPIAILDPLLYEGFAVAEKLKKIGVLSNYYRESFNWPDEPHMKYHYVGVLESKSGFYSRGFGGYGYDLFNEKQAFWSMIGESVERWNLAKFDPTLGRDCVIATEEEIKDIGEAVSVKSIVGYSQELRDKKNRNHNLLLTPDSRYRWVKSINLTNNNNPKWLPLQLVSFTHRNRLLECKEPLILSVISNGAAAHTSHEKVKENGLLEVIQRDAFMIYWVNGLPSKEIDLETINDSRIEFIREKFKRYNLTIKALYLKTDIPVHTVLGVITDETGVGPAFSVGASSHYDLVEAIYAALREVWVCMSSNRTLMVGHIASKKNFNFNLNDIGHEERLLYWCPKEHLEIVSKWINPEKKSFTFINQENKSVKNYSELLSFFREKKMEVYYVNTSSPEIEKETGLVSGHVVVPKMQPLHLDEKLPCFGGERLRLVPESLGFKVVSPFSLGFPHPFP